MNESLFVQKYSVQFISPRGNASQPFYFFKHFDHPSSKLSGDLTDCLIGNLYRDFDPLFKAIEEFAVVPTPLEHGRAMAA